MPNEALLIVDFQNDFCAGGALGVPASQQIIDTVNEYARRFTERRALVVASRDWHPAVTGHFRPFGGAWPVHCLQGSRGAEFHPELRLPAETVIVSKGTEPDADGYSAFLAHLDDGTLLDPLLKQAGVRDLYIGGLATDYCVRSSVIDALRETYRVTVLLDASRGVDVHLGDSEAAIAAMVSAGAAVATLERLEERLG